MARSEHHSAHAFLLYFFIHILWQEPHVSGWIVFLILFFGFLPDIDGIYWRLKVKKKMETEFQHHLYYWTHWPLSYTPFIIAFVISLLVNFYPLYFLIPVIGIYYGHFFFDSISTGDGIMWGKIPWKKGHYAQYVNLFSTKTDGYHGLYWNVRYRKTIFFKIGHIAVIVSTVIILVLIFTADNFDIFYMISIIYLISFSLAGLKKYPEQYYREPPEGRYADYRRNPKYIEGLSEKNRKKLLKKYS